MSLNPGVYTIINKHYNLPVGRLPIENKSYLPKCISCVSQRDRPPKWYIIPSGGRYILTSHGAPTSFINDAVRAEPVPSGGDTTWTVTDVSGSVHTISNNHGSWTLQDGVAYETLVTLSSDESDKTKWIIQPVSKDF